MSNERFLKRNGLRRGPGGRYLCRWCHQEVAPPRRTFCSDACIHEWKLRSDAAYLRAQVFLRDRGVCSACGCDTKKVDRVIRQAIRLGAGAIECARAFSDLLKAISYQIGRSYWEADHMVAVVEGGGLCPLDNIRTLCRPCHNEATRALGRRRRQQLVGEPGVA